MSENNLTKYLPYLVIVCLIGYMVYPKLNATSKDVEILKSDKPDKKLIDRCVQSFGTRLINCCSLSPPQKKSKKIELIDYRKLNNGNYEIQMKVEWIGGVFEDDTPYWITGSLTVDDEGCHPTWLKAHDSGMFKPRCGRNCPLPNCF